MKRKNSGSFSNNNLIKFIIFKRRLRNKLKTLLITCITLFVFFLIIITYIHRHEICNFFSKRIDFLIVKFEKLFNVKTNNIIIKFNKDTLLDKQSIQKIADKFVGSDVNKVTMSSFIREVKKHNSIIDDVSIRRSLPTKTMVITIKEKKIIGFLLSEDCLYSLDKCTTNFIAHDNTIIPYTNIVGQEKLLVVYGNISNADVSTIKNVLEVKHILEKVHALHFYSNGRFEIILKNGIKVKLPKNNWIKGIDRFIKYDAEFGISNEIKKTKINEYIDLRQKDKIYIK